MATYRQLDNGYVVNEQGLIALQYTITQNPRRVVVERSGHDYFFNSINHVNLAWVYPEDVPMLLSIQEKGCNCNNGSMKQAFQIATLANVNIYSTNSQ